MSNSQTCWLQITSGRGPVECAFAVGKLSTVITKQATRSNCSVEIISEEAGPQKNTWASILLSISGANAIKFAADWHGSHKWICTSPYRPNNKRKNWFVAVNFLEIPNTKHTVIQTNQIKFETLRASGPGGQHANKTDSAVRATHLPTGLVILAREERSQHMNKKLALARLASMLDESNKRSAAENERELWATHDDLQRGNPVRVFIGMNFRQK